MLSTTAVLFVAMTLSPSTPGGPERKTCKSADGVPIVYSAAGSGGPALVFIHGAFASRRFWDEQIQAFSACHCVVALDLPGHGEWGCDRKKWSLPELRDDVRAVVEAEHLRKVVRIGNSLGGPVAVEAALRLPGKVLGVVGVDTFRTQAGLPAGAARQRAEAFRKDYPGTIKETGRLCTTSSFIFSRPWGSRSLDRSRNQVRRGHLQAQPTSWLAALEVQNPQERSG
jgi:pimeloyl-ACP methyl ester carboxylesterase